jgi:phosphoglycolate phosphatase-like HAD superfamily hydrolase
MTSKPRAVIFDMDGTLAVRDETDPGVRKWYDWARVGEDLPNKAVVELAHLLIAAQSAGGPELVVVSGRDEICEPQTSAWLRDLDVFYSALYMRAHKDNRKDTIVKREIYEREIVPRWDVAFVVDDRRAVVEMWRELGLTCFQVADGDF